MKIVLKQIIFAQKIINVSPSNVHLRQGLQEGGEFKIHLVQDFSLLEKVVLFHAQSIMFLPYLIMMMCLSMKLLSNVTSNQEIGYTQLEITKFQNASLDVKAVQTALTQKRITVKREIVH